MLAHSRRSSTSGLIVPTPFLPGLPTRAMKHLTCHAVNSFRRKPESRHLSTIQGGADAPRSTTVRTGEVTGIPSTSTMSDWRRSLDSWTMKALRLRRRCLVVTISIRRGCRDVIPHRTAAVSWDAAAGRDADRTAAMTSRSQDGSDPAYPYTPGWIASNNPNDARRTMVRSGKPQAMACPRVNTPRWIRALCASSRSRLSMPPRCHIRPTVGTPLAFGVQSRRMWRRWTPEPYDRAAFQAFLRTFNSARSSGSLMSTIEGQSGRYFV